METTPVSPSSIAPSANSPEVPANSTFSTPPPSNSKLPLIIIVSILLILLVLGAVYYFFVMMKTPVLPTTQNTVPQTATSTPTPTIYDTSDEGLINDTSTIEINMSELESNAASVDSGLTEATPNL